MFAFLFQLPRILASISQSVAHSVSQTISHNFTQVAATVAVATATLAVPLRMAISNNHVGDGHGKVSNRTENVSTNGGINYNAAPENKGNTYTAFEQSSSSQDTGEPALNLSQSVPFSAPTATERVGYTMLQRDLTVVIDNVRSTPIGKALVDEAAAANADLVIDFKTNDFAYYNPKENQIALGAGFFVNMNNKALVAAGTLSLMEELGHITQDKKDSLFIHEYLNEQHEFQKFCYMTPEDYIHMRRHIEATSKIRAFMAFDDWGKTPEGKPYVDAYCKRYNDYMAQAFEHYQNELGGRIDTPSKILAGADTYLYLMTNDDFLSRYDRRLDEIPNGMIWAHPDSANFNHLTHDLLHTGGIVRVAGSENSKAANATNTKEFNFLDFYVDLNDPVFRQYSEKTVAYIKQKSEELGVSAPEFFRSEVPHNVSQAVYMPVVEIADTFSNPLIMTEKPFGQDITDFGSPSINGAVRVSSPAKQISTAPTLDPD